MDPDSRSTRKAGFSRLGMFRTVLHLDEGQPVELETVVAAVSDPAVSYATASILMTLAEYGIAHDPGSITVLEAAAANEGLPDFMRASAVRTLRRAELAAARAAKNAACTPAP